MLSVVVPIYNSEKHLNQCIDSILNQSFNDIELILVDDGSTDSSRLICESYKKKDERVKVILGKHKGPYHARKEGVKNSSGDYVTFVDSDDFISEKSYILSLEDMNEKVDIIIFDIKRYFNDGHSVLSKCSLESGYYTKKKIIEKIYPIMVWDDRKNNFGIDPALCNKIYKSTLIKEQYKKIDDVDFHYGEDVALVYPLISNAESISIIEESYYFHRQRNNGEMASYIKDELYLDKLYSLYKNLSKNLSFNDIFQRQIDLFYINSVELAKEKYNINYETKDKLFPFDKVKKGEKIIIYGAGLVGMKYKKQINQLNYCEIVCIVDKNFKNKSEEVYSPEEIFKTQYNKIIIAIDNKKVKNEVISYLVNRGIDKDCII